MDIHVYAIHVRIYMWCSCNLFNLFNLFNLSWVAHFFSITKLTNLSWISCSILFGCVQSEKRKTITFYSLFVSLCDCCSSFYYFHVTRTRACYLDSIKFQSSWIWTLGKWWNCFSFGFGFCFCFCLCWYWVKEQVQSLLLFFSLPFDLKAPESSS